VPDSVRRRRDHRTRDAGGVVLSELELALASEFEPVTCLEAPEPAEVPASLLRAGGRRVYQRHGASRYAALAGQAALI
jgi:hypothetical protein